MAAGVPVVAFDIRGYRTVLTDGVEGLLVPPKDVHALAKAIVQLLQDPARRKAMGQRGQARARAYGWSSVAERILRFYSWLRAQRQSVSPKHFDEWEVEHALG
jgi:glycosyltransferase involved in cell wall biosynthesis